MKDQSLQRMRLLNAVFEDYSGGVVDTTFKARNFLITWHEGVETTEDWQMLATLGCSAAQGFLISPAVPGEELVATIGRWRRPN
jgi:predicted signal transduction protein with EAL and GGDEF domain